MQVKEQITSPEYQAVRSGDVEEVLAWIQRDPEILLAWYHQRRCLSNNEIENDPSLPEEKLLHVAAQQGNLQMVSVLIDAGAEVNGRPLVEIEWEGGDPELGPAGNAFSDTPLHRAVRGEHTEIVRLLLERGADPNPGFFHYDHGDFNDLPLHCAVKSGNTELVSLLLSSGACMDYHGSPESLGSALHTAARDGHLHIAQILIDSGSEVDANGFFDYSPLHVAAREGHADIVRLLLERGAQADTWDDEGSHALIDAIVNGHAAVVEALLEGGLGSNISLPSRYGSDKPLDIAVEEGKAEIVNILVKYGAVSSAPREILY